LTSNIDPEEARAIFDALAPPAAGVGPRGVEPRDFSKPARLGPRRLEALSAATRRALDSAEAELSRRLRGPTRLELVELGEVSCARALSELEAPLAALRFLVAGEPGWALWDTAGAVAAVEVALGAALEEPPAPRALSMIERSVLADLMSGLLRAVTTALGLTTSELRVIARLEDLGSWRDGGERADPQRLYALVQVTGPGVTSTLRLLFPGVSPEPVEKHEPAASELPEHLQDVEVTMTAWLGCADVPLGDLLGIEPGDVIPLGVEAGAPVTLRVEDIDCATAYLGDYDGHLAVIVDKPVDPPPEEPPKSEAKQ
jgi:flagellar motor switch protein FliM